MPFARGRDNESFRTVLQPVSTRPCNESGNEDSPERTRVETCDMLGVSDQLVRHQLKSFESC